jgi:adenylosuccinate synthase
MPKEAYIIVDISNGDSGKGTLTDWLTREKQSKLTVRYNGGGQAAHTVVTPSGEKHVFSQLGSGSFVEGVKTLLGNKVIVDPNLLISELDKFECTTKRDISKQIFIDEECLIVHPVNIAINRAREIVRGRSRHGSCGKGIGETVSDSLLFKESELLRAKDILNGSLREKIALVRDKKIEVLKRLASEIPQDKRTSDGIKTLEDNSFLEKIAECFESFSKMVSVISHEKALEMIHDEEGPIVFEGAQGALLHENYGFHPFTTWSDTSSKNACDLLEEANYSGEVQQIGVLRSYSTRHGAGPFPTECLLGKFLTGSEENEFNLWQQYFKTGHLDLVMLRYALKYAGDIDYLAMTHLDVVENGTVNTICDKYHGNEFMNSEYLEGDPDGYIKNIVFKPEVDLDRQEFLGKILGHACKPVIEEIPSGDKAEFLKRVSLALGKPIEIISWGRTSLEKKFI